MEYPLIDIALQEGVGGIIVDGSMRAKPDGRIVGLPVRELALQQVAKLRERYGVDPLIIACGGVHEPEHALALRAAGANLVEVDTGLVYTGPGLPKRINDCLLFEATQHARKPSPTGTGTDLVLDHADGNRDADRRRACLRYCGNESGVALR